MSKHIRLPMLLARLYHIFFRLGHNNTPPPTKQYLKNILEKGASVWNVNGEKAIQEKNPI